MKMNFLESFVMNSFIRTWFLKNLEAPTLLELSGSLKDHAVLEIGCGQGVGTELLFNMFNAKKVMAMDIDLKMIRRAQKRLRNYDAPKLILHAGDATNITTRDEMFDAVVNFSALHHVPQWQKAITEIARVLKPGGRFIFEEVTRQWIERWPNRLLFLHPKESRFTDLEFLQELEKNGLKVEDRFTTKKKGDFIFGVGIRETRSIQHPK